MRDKRLKCKKKWKKKKKRRKAALRGNKKD